MGAGAMPDIHNCQSLFSLSNTHHLMHLNIFPEKIMEGQIIHLWIQHPWPKDHTPDWKLHKKQNNTYLESHIKHTDFYKIIVWVTFKLFWENYKYTYCECNVMLSVWGISTHDLLIFINKTHCTSFFPLKLSTGWEITCLVFGAAYFTWGWW